MIASSVVPPGSSPAIRPSCITSTRSQRLITSGSSDEMTSTAAPPAAISRSSR